MTKKQYVQFSKRIVVAVICAEFALCAITLTLACFGYDMSVGAEVIKAHTPFAIVTFVAYSGNSMVEKWLMYTARAKAGAKGKDEDDDSNG